MACFVPFNNRNLDISIFVFRPTVVYVEELLVGLKQFSSCTETLGCVQSSVLQSIHGNMIIWFGAWLKRSSENKESLTASLLSMLTHLSTKAILVDYTFFDALAGDSRDGNSCAAKFSTGDTVSMSVASFNVADDIITDVTYACLALFKSGFHKMEGVRSGVCLKCQTKPSIASFYVWKSLQFCYSWILSSDQRKLLLPYIESYNIDVKYDIFRVVYVSDDKNNNEPKFQFFYPHQMLEKKVGGDSKDEGEAYA